jgi:hypothetical protein
MFYSSIKYSHLIAIHAFLASLVIIFTAWYPYQAGGPHGGTMKKADDYFIETKTEDKTMLVYLMDTNLDDQSNKGISGDAKFFLAADSTTVRLPLQAFEEKAFRVETIPAYSECTITFFIASATVSAKFENQHLSVQQK